MVRRFFVVSLVLALTFGIAGCHNKKVQNPIANVDSKQPDKVLFDRAMEAMRSRKYDVARMSLQTLINTYPDSEYIARAKLAIGDSWYAEGGSAALTQAENEYKDFITFFPNMPEAAEAQMKVANIHYHQMEKADRDFTHAKRAEEEYRQVILQYPDSKLIPEAKQKLREVQEVLAEREFLIGQFYYTREAFPAAIARLESLVDTYPLYSGADEALFMLGDIYQREIAMTRANTKMKEDVKGRFVKDFTKKAEACYDRILTRYPVTYRAPDARRRLQAMKLPVPAATPEEVAENKKEQASREHSGMIGRAMLNMHRHPDLAVAAHAGEPTLTDPQQTNAVEVVRQSSDLALGKSSSQGKQSVSLETIGSGTPADNTAVPRSDSGLPEPNNSAPVTSASAPAAAGDTGGNGIPELSPTPSGSSSAPSTPAAGQSSQTTTPATAPAQLPVQVNDAANAPAQAGATGDSSTANSGASSSQQTGNSQQDDTNSSSSKKKDKKHKLLPF